MAVGFLLSHAESGPNVRRKDAPQFSWAEFRETSKIITSEFSDFYEFTLHMIYKNFHEHSHYRNGHFQKNREYHL